MAETPDPLKQIMYISLPEELSGEVGGMTIDSDILMPVEIVNQDPKWTMEHLSWEMIIAAMLKVLVYDPGHAHSDYYHRFILAVKPDIVDELSAAAIREAKQKNFATAEELFAALRALLPGDPTPGLNLALVYEERARAYEDGNRDDLREAYLEQAFELYTELTDNFPEDQYVAFNAGHFFLKMKNYDRARERFRSFLEISDDEQKRDLVEKILGELENRSETDELFRQAYDFIQLGKEREAIDRIRRFLQRQPDVWNAWFLLGWAHRRLEEYAEGKAAFVKAVELGGGNTDTYNELAICLMELEEFHEARETLRKALRADPENVKIISNLGILAIKRGNTEEARRYFNTVLEYEPDDPIAQHYLEYLRES